MLECYVSNTKLLGLPYACLEPNQDWCAQLERNKGVLYTVIIVKKSFCKMEFPESEPEKESRQMMVVLNEKGRKMDGIASETGLFTPLN